MDEWANTVVLVITHNRPRYLRRCLDSIFQNMAEHGLLVFVSQDGVNRKVSKVIQSYSDRVIHLQHLPPSPVTAPKGENVGYYRIAAHYKWALSALLNRASFKNVIILEDDLEIAADFFDYFKAALPLLKLDPSIWSISAWNDNGQSKYVNDPKALYRSNFFPGLGWLMNRKLWCELENKWPASYWDDWMRDPQQHQDRVCIRPEISRTRTYGKKGVSSGQYYWDHLDHIKLNDSRVDFSSINLNKLDRAIYDPNFARSIESAVTVTFDDLLHRIKIAKTNTVDLKITYADEQEFIRIAKLLGIMEDFWWGIPRTSYHGVVVLRQHEKKLFIVPSDFTIQP